MERFGRLTQEVCRKKWKSLRDTYLKERRKETEKRSGSAAGSGKKWKYSAVLSFLDPFVSPRETSGNMEREDESQAAGYDHPEDQGETEAAAGQSETGEPTGSFDGSEPGSPLPEPAAASASPVGPSTLAAVPTGVYRQ
ncbi:transcription factor Adf-1-like protein [Labeo rohita]|uniref:Transcription factor Adf-1-like protein n=1 Tax=Labeo rohita TaxID=84645 RepID=A0A498MEB1_LABRO|nr:transcription factor Adf-1-like protein [Labeo rohita]